MSTQSKPSGPPYAPRVASLGGLPSPVPDIPICAVLLAIYLSFAATNMTIFRRNRAHKHKFLPTIFIFGFCMARVATLVLRITWATRQHNVRIAIAANVLVSAGILIIYVLNLLFAQRILRSEQPQLGWSKPLKVLTSALYALIGAALVMVITSIVVSVYTLNISTLKACRDIQLAAGTYLLVFNLLPFVLLALAQFAPSSTARDPFGQGSMLRKKLVVLAVGCLVVTIAGFKTGVNWMPPRPITNPAWYHSKAAFYVFNFALEILALAIFTFSRPDKIFYVPNGSKKPGDYTRLRLDSKRNWAGDNAGQPEEKGEVVSKV